MIAAMANLINVRLGSVTRRTPVPFFAATTAFEPSPPIVALFGIATRSKPFSLENARVATDVRFRTCKGRWFQIARARLSIGEVDSIATRWLFVNALRATYLGVEVTSLPEGPEMDASRACSPRRRRGVSKTAFPRRAWEQGVARSASAVPTIKVVPGRQSSRSAFVSENGLKAALRNSRCVRKRP